MSGDGVDGREHTHLSAGPSFTELSGLSNGAPSHPDEFPDP